MIQAFKDGLDIHNFNASVIFNIPIEEVNKNQRKIAKGVTFGILYGSTTKALALNYFKGDINKAEELLDNFFNRFPKLKKFVDAKHDQSDKFGYTTSYTNRILYIEDIMLKDNTPDTNSRHRRAQNTCIQGGCLSGHSELKLLNGNKLRIDQLYTLPEEERWIYAYDEKTNKIVPAKFENPHITKYVNELIEVELDNGDTYQTTLDHKFMLRTGEYIEAKALKEGDSLMPLSTFNHKVKSVKVIHLDKKVPVYDITVPKYHNFVITCDNRTGIVIHNSEDVAGWIDWNIAMYFMENKMLSKTAMFIHDSFELDIFPTELFDVARFCDNLLNHETAKKWEIPMSSDVVVGPSIGQEIEISTKTLQEILTSQDENDIKLKQQMIDQGIINNVINIDSDTTKWNYVKLDCPKSGPGTIEDVEEMIYGTAENPNGWESAYKSILEVNKEENRTNDIQDYISWKLLMQGSHAPLRSNFGENVTKGIREYLILNELKDDYWDGYEPGIVNKYDG